MGVSKRGVSGHSCDRSPAVRPLSRVTSGLIRDSRGCSRSRRNTAAAHDGVAPLLSPSSTQGDHRERQQTRSCPRDQRSRRRGRGQARGDERWERARGGFALAVKMRVEAPALPARRTQRERRESTRRRLLDAAIDVIYERGFSSATTAAIAKRAGVTRGAIFHHFGTRGGLLLAILEDFRSELSIRLPGDAAAGPGSAGRLERLLERYWEISSSRRFIAVVQIQLGTIHDPANYPEVLGSMEQSATEFDRGWVAIFAGHDVAPDRVIAAGTSRWPRSAVWRCGRSTAGSEAGGKQNAPSSRRCCPTPLRRRRAVHAPPTSSDDEGQARWHPWRSSTSLIERECPTAGRDHISPITTSTAAG